MIYYSESDFLGYKWKDHADENGELVLPTPRYRTTEFNLRMISNDQPITTITPDATPLLAKHFHSIENDTMDQTSGFYEANDSTTTEQTNLYTVTGETGVFESQSELQFTTDTATYVNYTNSQSTKKYITIESSSNNETVPLKYNDVNKCSHYCQSNRLSSVMKRPVKMTPIITIAKSILLVNSQ